MSLTPRQLRRFWQAFRPAWLAHAGRSSIDPSDRAAAESWRHAVTAEECNGITSVRRLGNADFDAIMLRFAIEAGDETAIAYWAPAAERRLRHLLRRKLAALDRIDPARRHGPAYLAGILRQSDLLPPLSTLDDLPADHLRTALQILDTHLRRLRSRPPAALLEDAPF